MKKKIIKSFSTFSIQKFRIVPRRENSIKISAASTSTCKQKQNFPHLIGNTVICETNVQQEKERILVDWHDPARRVCVTEFNYYESLYV